MRKYVAPKLVPNEKVIFTQRFYFPFRGTLLAVNGGLLVLTDIRLLFSPLRLLGIPSFGESAVLRRSVSLRDVIGVEPVDKGGIEITTRLGESISIRIVSPSGPGFIWSLPDAETYRDETIRRIREACVQAMT